MQRFCLIFLLTISALCGCERLKEPSNPIVFEACAAMPEGRAAATAFAVGDKAYIFGGRTLSSDACKQHPEGYPKNMWQYDAAANAWSNLGEVPFGGRVHAAAQVVGDNVYVGLGFSGGIYNTANYRRDWWCYTPATHSWQQLDSFPNDYTDACVMYHLDGKIYACHGFGTYGYSRQIAQYDIANDKWTLYADNYKRAPSVISAVGAQVGDRCFLGSGWNADKLNVRQWYEFDPASDSWHERKKLPAGRVLSAVTTSQQGIFVLGGRHFGGSLTTGKVYDEVLEYNIESDEWLLRGHLPGGARENAVAFTIGKKHFVGLGNDADEEILNDLHAWHD